MSYYQAQGDYKTYGYAQQGDLKRLWRKVRGVAAPIIGGLVGGPFGAVIGAALGGRPKAPQPIQQVPTSFPAVGFQAGFIGPAVGAAGRVAGRVLRSPVTQAAAAAGAIMATVGPNGELCCQSGYHLAKDGSGRCVRNRRMNVANPRALRRGIRRVQGFEKLARKVINFNKRVRTK